MRDLIKSTNECDSTICRDETLVVFFPFLKPFQQRIRADVFNISMTIKVALAERCK